MKFSLFGRLAMAAFASLVMGLGMSACGGGTIGYIWVIGQQYNNVDGFKVDDFTGNLTKINNAPFASNGTVPVDIVVKPGGRYVYVINQGTGGTSSKAGTGQSIALYSVGGDGVLTFQQTYQTQGYVSLWASFDTTGQYLYVLDQYAPNPKTPGDGAITAFSSDSATGRLTLVTNQQTLNNGVATTYWEVGASPLTMRQIGSCLFTVSQADQSITPFSFAGGGQLGIVTNGKIVTTAAQISSINGFGSSLYVTDYASNTILPYSVGGSCSLGFVTGGTTPNFAGTQHPVYSYTDSTGKYLYVLNQSTTSTGITTPYSSISAFIVNSTTSQLQQIAGAPYPVGSYPVCMVEDPTNQYFYISGHNDGTVTGKLLDPTTGILYNLKRGSTFTTVGQTGCLVISGATS